MGVGLGVFGVIVCISDANKAVATALTLYKPTGPLSGKVAVGVAVWLVLWALLDRMWSTKNMAILKSFAISLGFMALGLALTFPPIMDIVIGK